MLLGPALLPVHAATISNFGTLSYEVGPERAPKTEQSNTVTLQSVPDATQSRLAALRHAPDDPDAEATPADGSFCADGAGGRRPSGVARDADGNPISPLDAAPLSEAALFAAGDAIFVVLEDANRNTDDDAREFVEVTLTTSEGDSETLELFETDIASGRFAGFMQTELPPPDVQPQNCVLTVVEDTAIRISYTDIFFNDDTAVVDVAIAAPSTNLVLDKQASRAEASTGDFLRYQLVLRNLSETQTSREIEILDQLPAGLRYQPGSSTLDGSPLPEDQIVREGRSLRFSIGDLPPGTSRMLAYVVEVSAEAREGDAVNRARATTVGGGLSNEAVARVLLRSAFFDRCSVLIGRVTEGQCELPAEQLPGVEGVRLFLEDGTYTSTDEDGLFHFEGVCDGTHVVRLDLDTLPAGLEAVPCEQNTRFGGRPDSQFVDLRGGALWRTDFRVQRRGGDLELELETRPDAELSTLDGERRTRTFQGRYDSGSDRLDAASLDELERLAESLAGLAIDRMEIVGHTDDQPLSARSAAVHVDNYGLSSARARRVGHYLARRLGLDESRWNYRGAGPDQPVAGNDTEAGRARNRRVEIRLVGASGEEAPRGQFNRHRVTVKTPETLESVNLFALLPDGVELAPDSLRVDGIARPWPSAANPRVMALPMGTLGSGASREIEFSTIIREHYACRADSHELRVLVAADSFRQRNLRTPLASTPLRCPDASGPVLTRRDEQTARLAMGGPRQVSAPPAAAGDEAPPRDDVLAAGGVTDWLAEAGEKTAWLFPGPDHNPRAAAVRVVISHPPGHRVQLYNEGREVSPLRFDGSDYSADGRRAVSIWRGVELKEGANRLEAVVRDGRGGAPVRLERVVYFANVPVRAELVPEQSRLLADGVRHPRIAVRFLDRRDRPVRNGVTGGYQVNPPYVPRVRVEEQQDRQLAGVEGLPPAWQVSGDDGIAIIELEPTTETGEVVLEFKFTDGRVGRRQDLRAWLQPSLRDWIVVGFAEGTLGYTQLSENMDALPPDADEVIREGQISLFARGRIRGDWLMTLAMDTDLASTNRQRNSLFGVIDPDAYYTLYGDRAQQHSAAPTSEHLYLKLERRQFFALFGDFETGLTESELARYSRALTGLRVAWGGETFELNAFAADTPQRFIRDEIQGDGTSGPYRLSRPRIVLNSERVRIETRDRLRPDQIVESRPLARHIDYDIDYPGGRLVLREPLPARDTDFNPNFLVAEYEVTDGSAESLNAGARAAVQLADGDVELGASVLRDAAATNETDVAGLDATVRLGRTSELRLESAASRSAQGAGRDDPTAWLAEFEHNGAGFDALVHARRQEPGFGVEQQSGTLSGQFRAGATTRVALRDDLSMSADVLRQDNLENGNRRDLATVRLDYTGERWDVGYGLQLVADTASDGERFDSRQAFVSASRRLLQNRLELEGRGDLAITGDKASADFPNRYVLQARYKLTEQTRLIVAEEYTDGRGFDSFITRVGLHSEPWRGGRVVSTVNQDINEFGPRTFAALGLSQTLQVGERWSVDLSLDHSRQFNESGELPPIINDASPFASGNRLESQLPDGDYLALSSGATYRAPLWSWNLRLESRDAEDEDRYGVITAFLRQIDDGLAFSSSLQGFVRHLDDGQRARDIRVDLSWAWRPLDRRWAILDRLRLRHESVSGGSGEPAFGFDNLALIGSGRSSAIIHHLNLNRTARRWEASDDAGDPFGIGLQNQLSLYFGNKYVRDEYDGRDYAGFSHMIGTDLIHDLGRRFDVGVAANLLLGGGATSQRYAIGPRVGVMPSRNVWLTLGYNFEGFRDRDFEAVRYTAQGPYLKLRFKFDERTRLFRDDAEHERAVLPQ